MMTLYPKIMKRVEIYMMALSTCIFSITGTPNKFILENL